MKHEKNHEKNEEQMEFVDVYASKKETLTVSRSSLIFVHPFRTRWFQDFVHFSSFCFRFECFGICDDRAVRCGSGMA